MPGDEPLYSSLTDDNRGRDHPLTLSHPNFVTVLDTRNAHLSNVDRGSKSPNWPSKLRAIPARSGLRLVSPSQTRGRSIPCVRTGAGSLIVRCTHSDMAMKRRRLEKAQLEFPSRMPVQVLRIQKLIHNSEFVIHN